MSRSVLSRATDVVANRLDRRSFLTRTAVAGSALVAAPADFLLRPGTAYAAICSCQGRACECGSRCCDGYTELCCALSGVNACPTGSLVGGWWKADGSSFCGGAARYYMDCHKPCGSCGCGGSGLCSGSCNGTACGCGRGRCDHRKAGCTSFRYGNCNNGTACIGPIQCRVVSCTPPWVIEPTCSSSAVRTDNGTRAHNRPCLQQVPPITMLAGAWLATGRSGLGYYDNRTGRWNIRSNGGSILATPTYGQKAGDRPVVGDWNGNGTDSIGVFRKGTWYLSNGLSNATFTSVTYGQTPGDIPVVGDWNGDGTDSIGVFRKGTWYLSNGLSNATFASFAFGQQPGDIPVVGDWNGDGRDSPGIFRSGTWYLSNTLANNVTTTLSFGNQPGDIPVVGDWTGAGRDSIGVYRPAEGRWYVRSSLHDPSPTVVTYGPRWYLG